MVKTLVAASLLWPLVMAAAVWQRTESAGAGWTWLPYAIGHQICHQRAERSFHTGGVQWPVCGRCSGLYLAAPIGALVAAGRRRWRQAGPWPSVIAASVPTVITVAGEWTGLVPVGNLARFVSAVPLGFVVAYWVTRAAAGPARSIRYTDAS